MRAQVPLKIRGVFVAANLTSMGSPRICLEWVCETDLKPGIQLALARYQLNFQIGQKSVYSPLMICSARTRLAR